MRFLFCFLILLTACKGGSSSSGSSTQSTTTQSSTTETPSSPTVTPTPTPTPTPSPSPVPLTEKEAMTEEFMKLINDHRESIGVKALVHVEGLQAIVEEHSSEMASGAVAFGHDGFSSRCTLGREVLGSGNWCGENVAMGQKTVSAAYTAWMNSPGHRANIENTKATHTGFGFAKSAKGTWYWTQIFLQKN